MANFRILHKDLVRLGTVTSASVFTDAGPVTYLQNDRRGLIAQASSAASQDIKVTWGGTAYTISQMCLYRHNLVYSDTIRLILYPNADWTGTPIYDSTALAAYVSGLFDDWGWAFTNRYFTAAPLVKSAKLTVAASAAALQAARLFLGAYTEAPIQPAEGFTITPEDNSTQERSEGGSLDAEERANWRSAKFDMMVQTEAQRAAWFEIGRYCGKSRSVVASFHPGDAGTSERDLTIAGKFSDSIAQKISQNKFDFSMSIEEL